MTRKDLETLKSTLHKIEENRGLVPKLEIEINEINEYKSKEEKEISNISKKIQDVEKLAQENDSWTEEKKEKENHNSKWLEKAKEKVEIFSREEKPLIEKTESEIRDLRTKSYGTLILTIAVSLFFITLIGGAAQGWKEADKLPRGEWVCDNGEVIALLDVLDDEEHCSDGSDEDRNWFSDSRAEKAKNGDEYEKLDNAKWDLWIETTCLTSLPSIILIMLGYVYKVKRMKPVQLKIEELEEENKKRVKKEKSLKNNVKSWVGKNDSIQLQIKDRARKINSLEDLRNTRKSHKSKVNQFEKDIIAIEEKIRKLQSEEQELWDSIKNLIPFGHISFEDL